MQYQCSLGGRIGGRHAQLNFYDVDSFEEAMDEVKSRKHLPRDEHEESLVLLFSDRSLAIKDGIPAEEIEDVWGDGELFRWKPPQ